MRKRALQHNLAREKVGQHLLNRDPLVREHIDVAGKLLQPLLAKGVLHGPDLQHPVARAHGEAKVGVPRGDLDADHVRQRNAAEDGALWCVVAGIRQELIVEHKPPPLPLVWPARAPLDEIPKVKGALAAEGSAWAAAFGGCLLVHVLEPNGLKHLLNPEVVLGACFKVRDLVLGGKVVDNVLLHLLLAV